jgi:hypothetical protein
MGVVHLVRGVLCIVLDVIEAAVCLVFKGGRSALKSSPFMSGDWLPNRADIGTHKELSIRGEIPKELAGAYLRVGPNARFDPHSPMHLFDGDGAVAAFTLRPEVKGEKACATLAWDYVQTEKLLGDVKAGRSRALTLGSLDGSLGTFIHGTSHTTSVPTLIYGPHSNVSGPSFPFLQVSFISCSIPCAVASASSILQSLYPPPIQLSPYTRVVCLHSMRYFMPSCILDSLFLSRRPRSNFV